MKLSRKQLEDFIVGSMRDNLENGWDSEQERAALESLQNDTLEIEGYEHSAWVKFNPDDPKTFPPDDGKNVLGYNPEFSDEPFECFLGFDYNFYCPQDKIRFPLPTHWRPLPKPPTETEEK